jgi:Copper type II ascorbate-dependent monooxygenase, C-terminal domain
MKRFAHLFVALSIVFAFAACSTKSTSTTDAPDAAAPNAGTPITFTMASTVPAGSETHKCQFLTAPPGSPTYVVAGEHAYTPGSHHMLLFRTDLTQIPAGQEGVQDCYESATSFMSHVRGLLYGAQTPTGQLVYPPGVALPLVAGEVFLMQTHYLNAGTTDLDANAHVTLTVTDGSDVTQRAGILFYYDPFIDVPPGVNGARASTRCLVPNDVTLLTASSHFHKRGVDYAAYVDPPSGPLASTPFYTSKDWDHPTSLAAPLAIPAGSRIRYGCTYDNAAGTKEYFQGQSAENDEMCMFIATYYPAMTLFDELCTHDRDMIGTGAAPCGASLACIRACPSGAVPTGGGLTFDADPCLQKCMVASCPAASGKLLALSACTKANCANECATPGSSACTACAQAKCLTEAAACQTDTCP